MDISTTWLREWVNPKVSDKELAETLTMAGLEVDGINPVAPPFNNVVIGHVESCEKHPDADKLNLCIVNTGSEKLQIICGAKNVRKDLKVAVATVGSVLPSGLEIKKAKLRGVESNGMICSESELGLVENSEGILELEPDAPIGEDIRSYLDLDDNIVELDITPNRGDCFSILGVAREVCANFNLNINAVETANKESISDSIKATLLNPEACPKYCSRLITNIDNTKQTPHWMQKRLKRSGQQSHSPIVDITNYVLLELGQPMHAFDLEKIDGQIIVRKAKQNEKLELLNGQTVELNNDTLVIADNKSAIAMAGIMGGESTSTQPDSTEILYEAAFFEPVNIAGKARSYGLHTESSLRFERGVDFELAEKAIERATELTLEICGGKAGPIQVEINNEFMPNPQPISISIEKIQTILGFDIDFDWATQKFQSLDFEIIGATDSSWTIQPPSHRFDIRIPEDLVEELARLYGYDKLPVKPLNLNATLRSKPESNISKNKIIQSLVNRGYQEVITYSFISPKLHDLVTPSNQKITLANPISLDMSIMRSSLWPGLLQSLSSNLKRGHQNIKFFETGLCFNGTGPNEQVVKIAGVISGNRFEKGWSNDTKPLDFFDIKADLESLISLGKNSFSFQPDENPALQIGQTASIAFKGKVVGWIGSISPYLQQDLSLPKCYLFEIELDVIKDGMLSKYKKFSQYQKSERDIAVLIDKDIQISEVLSAIQELSQNDLIDVQLFDLYQGDKIETSKKSIALNLSYQSFEMTLTDEIINSYVDQVLKVLQDKFSAEQR